MYSEHRTQHRRPHLHAAYQQFEVVLAVDTMDVLAGQLPRRQQRLLEAWAELHQQELTDAWHVLQAGQNPDPIEPLK